MSTRMLIDARHSEETRVAVVKGNRVEDFDYESSNKVQIKGNIYLAKITRVEPSLQAAFVEYGGNRHGFLAFSEIHPDYYQIPVEDREALLAEEAAIQSEVSDVENTDVETDPEDKSENSDETIEAEAKEGEVLEGEVVVDDKTLDAEAVEEENSEEDDEELDDRLRLRRLRALKRRYKIQEVIKPRQIILIQVVKEERGNKGAALTSYISLAGRYTVLMPNTTHGGGISRKISNASDRKRLKSIVDDLDIPAGTGCIVRTAGMKRTKTEIKRDVEYIQKIWSNIRELTLKSVAPSMVYEEGNLIKRAIRDLYDRSIDEVQVEGEEGYKVAKEFMTLLMPSHAKRVHHYKDGLPLFQRYQVEEQLDGIFDPNVTLKSGGYLVINPTEALISIDVNSGKSTKQHNIESTAFKTNLEAAVEIGRQLRLRDLAGLVVIDFIDMEERSHNRKVENKMKEAIKADRARIMVNRISSLGLMEISRQRLRPNLEEASSEMCPNCEGTGRIRNKESAALHVLRAIENEGFKRRNSNIAVSLNPEVAFYVLNKKRSDLISLEEKYGISLELTGNPALISPKFELTATGPAPVETQKTQTNNNKQELASEDNTEQSNPEGNEEQKPRRRRRRGGRGRGKYGRNRFYDENDDKNSVENSNSSEEKVDGDTLNNDNDEAAKPEERDDQKQPRRRNRRGGRRSRYSRGGERNNEKLDENTETLSEAPKAEQVDSEKQSSTDEQPKAEAKKPARRGRKKAEPKKVEESTEAKAEVGEEKPAEKPKRKPRAKKADKAAEKTDAPAETKAETEEKPKKPRARRKTATSKAKNGEGKSEVANEKAVKPTENVQKVEPKAQETKDDKPKKRGWWQRGKAEKVES